jgi:serine/alanine racemase
LYDYGYDVTVATNTATEQRTTATGDSVAAAGNFNAIDVARCVFAICIVAIHTNPFQNISATASFITSDILFRMGVPFFFLTAGFFFFRKIDLAALRLRPDPAGAERLKQYVIRLLKVYIVWSLIYAVPFVVECSRNDDGFARNAFRLTVAFLTGGVCNHLWYLTALMFSVVLVHVALRRVRPVFLLMFAVGWYIVGLSLWTYSMFIQNDLWSRLAQWNVYANELLYRLPRGLIFVVLGAMLSQRRALTVNKTACLLLFLASVGAMFAESFLLRGAGRVANLEISVALVPASLFLFLLLTNLNWKNHPLILYVRISSRLIYFVHPLFIYIYFMFNGVNLYAFLTVTACSILFAVTVVALTKRTKKNRVLSWLY